MRILLGVLLTVAALIVVSLIYIYSGWYNVSAMNEESGMMQWVFNTTKNKSVESRIEDISIPELNDSAMINEGFEHYKAMCVSCHGAPGLEETELTNALNPPAPYLVKFVGNADPKELFWVTKNGIRMTGMPAWGKTHSDEKIWAIVAFMKMLPEMSAEEYMKMGLESENAGMGKNQKEDDKQNEHSHTGSEHHH